MIELYHAHISTCSQKVRFCLAEKNIDWTSKPLDFSLSEQLSEDYLRINPNGVVPTLVDNGKAIVDSSVICEYLDDAYSKSGSRLSPNDAYGRAQLRAWLRYIEEVPTAAIRAPSFNMLFKPFIKAKTEQQRQEHIQRTPLRKDLYTRFGSQGFSETEIESSEQRLSQTLKRMDEALKNGPWLLGEQFSIADICVLPTVVRMDDLRLNNLWENFNGVKSWYTRIQARPAFELTYYTGSRVAIGDPNVLDN